MLVPKRVKHRREFRGKMRGLENMVFKQLLAIGSQTAKSKLLVSL